MIRYPRWPSRMASVSVFALSILGLASAAHAETSRVLVVNPTHGASFDVGSKYVVGYFVNTADACQVTLMMSDKIASDEVPSHSAARIRQTVLPNATARVDTAEGESLVVRCHPHAAAMTVHVTTTLAQK